MIQLTNISVAFGGQRVIDGISWSIKPGRRIGLVGPNGAGKSTLLKVICGVVDLDAGTVSIPSSASVGYLEQDVQEMDIERAVLDEAMQAFAEVFQLQAEEERLNAEVAAHTDYESAAYEKLLHDVDDVHTKLAAQEAHLIKPRTQSVLSGLGFSDEDLARPLHEFSGGWRMRVALAKLLLRTPEYLLLDEPTNHLDIDSIAWLEDYLRTYRGTVVMVSHDRYFLDRMINEIAELHRGQITEYTGNYAHYLEERDERRILQQAAFDNQQREIAQAERFITRFRAKATKARQVQSRVKALERLERLQPPPTDSATIHIRFPEPRRSGKVVLDLSQFSKTYETADSPIHVFTKTGPVSVERGDKIALIGRNGAGKSTLARIINGTEPFDGERQIGHNVEVAFFAQHQADTLESSKTVLETMYDQARGHTETQLRSILGAFLFHDTDVEKRVSVLSGGEKNRLALARTLLVPANFLVLDEPTNHLDMQSVNVLIEALQQYTGTFVVVSHNRHFLDQVANKIWRAEDGVVRQYVGNYSDYVWQAQHGTASQGTSASGGRASDATETAHQHAAGHTAGSKKKTASGRKTKEQKRLEAEERARLGPRTIEGALDQLDELSPHALQKLYKKLEQRIFQSERKQRTLEKDLSDPAVYDNFDQARENSLAYEALKEELATMYQHWERIAERLEKV